MMSMPEDLRAYNVDLHIHSALSPCGSDDMLPSKVIDKLKVRDIEIFSITDHNSCANVGAFKKKADERGLVFIPGIEIQTQEEIHLLAYFDSVKVIEKFYTDIIEPGLMVGMKNDPDTFGSQFLVDKDDAIIGEEERILSLPLTITLEEAVEGISGHGGIAVPAHLDRGFSIISQLGFLPPDLDVDLVEIADTTKINDLRKQYFPDKDIRVISSSDTHHLHMFKSPKMKFKMPDIRVGTCMECLRGQVGKISIVESRPKPKPRALQNKGKTSGRDWKSIYG